jgi:acetate kinase
MDRILVINAGSSSVKFEVFAVNGSAKLTRKIKGQIDGIGTRPRLRARRGDDTSLVDREYQAGRETDCAVSMLHALETCLHALEQHRETLFERCKT